MMSLASSTAADTRDHGDTVDRVSIYLDTSGRFPRYHGEVQAFEQAAAAAPAVTAHRYSGGDDRCEVDGAAEFAREIGARLDPDTYWLGEAPVGRLDEVESRLARIADTFDEDIDDLLEYRTV